MKLYDANHVECGDRLVFAPTKETVVVEEVITFDDRQRELNAKLRYDERLTEEDFPQFIITVQAWGGRRQVHYDYFDFPAPTLSWLTRNPG